jgi:bloom syndrome protein
MLAHAGLSPAPSVQVLALVSLKSAADPSLSGVPATYLGSTAPSGHSQAVYTDLNLDTPLTKLLYVTPEQLMHNERLRDALSQLHRRRMLARIVIDEVR